MGILKIGAGISGVAIALAFSTAAFAEGPVVNSEASCLEQDGSIMDLQGVKHCLAAVVPEEFQGVEYAGEIKGVHSCKKENTRKTQIGDFCLLALEAKPAAAAKPSLTDAALDIAKDEAEKAAKSEAKKGLAKALDN